MAGRAVFLAFTPYTSASGTPSGPASSASMRDTQKNSLAQVTSHLAQKGSMITKSDAKLSVAVHVSSPSTREAGQGDEKFKVTPDYTVSSKTIWTTRDPILKKTRHTH